MSTFSSLLAQLQNSVKEDNQKGSTDQSRKRPRDEGRHETGTGNRQTVPHDYQDLTINLSFLCIGAQKAGTTWLHEILHTHPNISLPIGRKEVHFFDWNRRKGLGWYSNQFVSSNQERLFLGEITPCYAILPESRIQEIRLLFPKLKIIFVARSLVERAWSAILMELRNASRGIPPGEFQDSLEPQMYDSMEDPRNYDDEYFMQRLQHPTHKWRSDYATALRRWLQYFPPQQILILHYTDISRDPRRFVQQVCAHIGLSATELLKKLEDGDLKKKVNAATGPSSNYPLSPTLRKRFEEYLEPFTRDFNHLLEELKYPWRLESQE